MIFCGQCGFQVPPSAMNCPRCGSFIDDHTTQEDLQLDGPTVPSKPVLSDLPTRQSGVAQPQRLVLRDGGSYDYSGQGADEATNMIDTPPNYGQPAQQSYPGFDAQSGGTYSPQTSYPGFGPQGGVDYTQYPDQYGKTTPQTSQKKRGRGRIVSLLLILCGLLLILGVIILFTFNPGGLLGGFQATPTPTATATPTPSQQAQALIQQFYDDINKKDYQDAYNLWDQYNVSEAKFADGFANTVHDDISFTSVAPQDNGSVQVVINLNATEDNGSGGTKVSHYTVTYKVGQKDGAWKILSGKSVKNQ